MSKIIVIGSSNTDLIIRSPYFPRPGETIVRNEFKIHSGEKDANQAIAASRLGGDLCFISRVGNDNQKQ
ncbi:PfkB family carbohydrate kinase [Aquimarina algiphila]|uniref:PfkB family carbohydrate kinase n=1 Tax=Aquimarina algiphila TaxID=2047982 RepID=UPI002492A918|nr:PfkB family carbohydrate kinase [Aquimarina algiphila]